MPYWEADTGELVEKGVLGYIGQQSDMIRPCLSPGRREEGRQGGRKGGREGNRQGGRKRKHTLYTSQHCSSPEETILEN